MGVVDGNGAVTNRAGRGGEAVEEGPGSMAIRQEGKRGGGVDEDGAEGEGRRSVIKTST